MLTVNGSTATLTVNTTASITFTYAPTVIDGLNFGLNWGLLGFGSQNARGAMDNITVQVLPPVDTVARTDDFSGATSPIFAGELGGGTFALSGGRYVATPTGSEAATSLANLSGLKNVATTSILDFSATLRTTARAGFIFDQYTATDYKFAAIDVQSQAVMIGYRKGANWTVNLFAARTITAGGDYVLGVSLRGSTATVTLGGQAVGSWTFNSETNDGRFGIFSKGGTASFDSISIQTNDPSVPATQQNVVGTKPQKVATTTPEGAVPTVESMHTGLTPLKGSAVAIATPRVAFDWGSRPDPAVTAVAADDSDRRDDWQTQFVNHLGANAKQRNPNDGLEIKVSGRGMKGDEPDTL
jgi:hypothetical protein